MSVAIKVKNVSKSFNDSVILDDISIDFYENKIYGLLGKNGVGKTTLLNIITKQLISKSGTIEIFGQNINESDDVLDKLCILTHTCIKIMIKIYKKNCAIILS